MIRSMTSKVFWAVVSMSVPFALFAPEPAFAVGEAGAAFLKIGVGAKAAAMGGAFTGIADDLSSVYWNPAGLRRLNRPTFMGTYHRWFQDMRYHHLAFAYPSKPGVFGVAFTYFGSGDIPAVDENLQETGTFRAFDFCAAFAFATRLTEGTLVGAEVKAIYSGVEVERAYSVALDIGTLVSVSRVPGLRFGLLLSNLGPEIKYIAESAPLPLSVRVGASYGTETRVGEITLAVEVSKSRDMEAKSHFGVECVVRHLLSLRGGLETRPMMKEALNFGIGILHDPLELDYAYLPFEEIEGTHCVSISLGM